MAYNGSHLANNKSNKVFVSVVASLTLVTALVGTVQAQNGPRGGGPNGQRSGFNAFNGQGGPNQPGQYGQNGNMQGRSTTNGGGGQGQPPMVMGTIQSGDASLGTIVISTPSGNSLTIRVTSSTQFMTQVNVAVSSLQVNDIIRVQGMPSGANSASGSSTVNGYRGAGTPNNTNGQTTTGTLSVAERQARAAAQRAGAQRSATGTRTTTSQSTGTVTQSSTTTQSGTNPQDFGPAEGRVVSLSPLTITDGNGTRVLHLASSATVSKLTSTTYSNLQVGNHLMATGQFNTDGTFTATSIGINMDMSGPAGNGNGSSTSGQGTPPGTNGNANSTAGYGRPGGPGGNPNGPSRSGR